MLHPGERTTQRRAGVITEDWGSAGVGATIPPVAAGFLAQQRLVVIAATDEDGAAWVSPLIGPPGFVQAPDDATIVTDRLPVTGDPLAERFDAERNVGMIVLDPASRRRMRINGRAYRQGHGLVVRTEQVYSNCPKYIQTRTPSDELPSAAPTATVTGRLTASQQQWIAAADTFFIGTYATGLGVDASHRGGNPGFVEVTGGARLTWPDYAGNSMYMTLGNLELEPRCGLLFLDWETGRSLYLTGRAWTDWDTGRAAAVPGAQRLVDFDVERVLQLDGALPNRWSFGRYSRFNPG